MWTALVTSTLDFINGQRHHTPVVHGIRTDNHCHVMFFFFKGRDREKFVCVCPEFYRLNCVWKRSSCSCDIEVS